MYAYAQASLATCTAQGFLDKLNEQVLYPLIILLLSAAFLYFLYGGLKYIAGANDPGKREEGRKHMFWGVIGLLVMVSAFAILTIVANSFGLSSAPPSC